MRQFILKFHVNSAVTQQMDTLPVYAHYESIST